LLFLQHFRGGMDHWDQMRAALIKAFGEIDGSARAWQRAGTFGTARPGRRWGL
jgi:hypothetical protein